MEENGMTTEAIREAFGLEPEETTDETVEETTEEPLEEVDETQDEPEEDPGEDPDEDPRQEMPPEERHRQAAARRAREEEARQAAEQARVDKIYREMFEGQTNPFTGQPIQGEADYRSYQAKMQQRQQQDQLKQAGIDPDTIQSMVRQQVAPLQQQVEQYQMREAQARAAEVSRRADAAIQQSLKNISAQMPEVQTLSDLAALPTAPVFNDMVQRGYSLEDAFYLANRETLTARAAKAARAAERNGTASKRHLGAGTANGELPVEVSAEEAALYRRFNPTATDAEIRAAYQKEH